MRRILFLAMACITFFNASAQKKKLADAKQPVQPAVYDASLLKNVNYRLLGPFRGGRSGAVGASYKSKNTFYFGATGGGVWKSIDGGSNWKNVSDKFLAAPLVQWRWLLPMKTSYMLEKAKIPCGAMFPRVWVACGRVKMPVKHGKILA